MSEQFEDTLLFENKKYIIIESTKKIFRPQEHGLLPDGSINSACCRGFCIDFVLHKNFLTVDTLYIETKDHTYPDINGTKVNDFLPGKYGIMAVFFHIYESLNLPVQFTGSILVGANNLTDQNTHFGTYQPWGYQILTELVFENGCLQNIIDLNIIASEMRKEIQDLNIKHIFFNGRSYKRKSKFKGAFWWF